MDINDILVKHKKWLNDEEGGERANLRDANLFGASLRDANLRGANLRDADLRGANLCGANLRDANLRDANLFGASLRDANLRGANLRDANLRDANLRGANLRDANLCGANLRGANLNYCAGNNKQIKSIFVSGAWPITYTAEYLQIGCQRHKISAWWEFGDSEISSMDSGALVFWHEMKDYIRMTIERLPAVPTGKEGQE